MITKLVNRYLDFESKQVFNHEKLSHLLGVNFSAPFKEIAEKGRFDFLSHIDFFSIDQEGENSVVGETLRLRENANLPKNTLILSEDDASLLLMKCLGDHEEIYWIAIEDYDHYCNDEPLKYKHTFFPTFTDFFSYLLDEEEKRRAEEKLL
jgi:hypothetical protein